MTSATTASGPAVKKIMVDDKNELAKKSAS
jgi:hypothetical protein